MREKLGRHEDALEDYEAAITTAPDAVTAQGYHALRGTLLKRLGRESEAAEELRIATEPPHAAPHP